MEIDRGSGDKSEEKEKDDSQKHSSQQSSWWGSWGQDWIATVKEKSSVTLNMVKKDLNEFVEVIQGDTAEKLSETASKLENENEKFEESNKTKDEGMEATAKVVKQGLSKILHSVSELISIDPDDSTEEVITLGDEKTFSANYNRKQEKLHFIQTNPGTYCNEPEGAFDDWLETFTLEDLKQEMSDLLVQNPSVRAIYTQLVPSVVSHTVFWQRYFYQIFLLDVEERKRKEILERANKMVVKENETEEDDDGWGDDDEIEILPKESVDKNIKKTEQTEDLKGSIPCTEIKTNDKVTEIDSADVPSEEPNVVTPKETESQKKDNTLMEKHVNKEKNIIIDGTTKSDRVTSASPKPIDKSHDTIHSDDNFSVNNTTQNSDNNSVKSNNNKSCSPQKMTKNEPLQNTMKNLKIDQSDMSSVSSWMSIDDDIRVKKTLGEVIMKNDSKDNSEGKTSDGSSAVLVNKSDADDLDDFDLDLEDDVNDEELQKMVQEIKNKSNLGNLQDDDEDDDWENWE